MDDPNHSEDLRLKITKDRMLTKSRISFDNSSPSVTDREEYFLNSSRKIKSTNHALDPLYYKFVLSLKYSVNVLVTCIMCYT